MPEDSLSIHETKTCPYCAEQVLAQARKCKHCGEFFEAQPRPFGRDNIHLILAVTGSLLLVIAPFAPFITAPVFGRLTLFQQGKGDGVILLVLALIALCLSAIRRYGFLWASGLFGLIEIGVLLHFFYVGLPGLIETYRRQTADNPFRGIGEIAISNFDADWGAAALVIGTLLTLGAAISNGVRKQTATRAGRICLALIGAFVVYQAILIPFPYLRAWPELLGSYGAYVPRLLR